MFHVTLYARCLFLLFTFLMYKYATPFDYLNLVMICKSLNNKYINKIKRIPNKSTLYGYNCVRPYKVSFSSKLDEVLAYSVIIGKYVWGRVVHSLFFCLDNL